jgi:hypothetical protein
MHERSPKASPLDTILYEIDILRHCARTLPAKKALAEKTNSDNDRSEYYLAIEGYLLHLRNLLAFLTSHRNESTDLGINDPVVWANREIEQREYSSLMKRAREINAKYGNDGSSCQDQISKFLQHCTTYRHEDPRSWDIEGISADIEPVLSEFEARFAPKSSGPAVTIVVGTVANSTSPLRTSAVLFDGLKGDPKNR